MATKQEILGDICLSVSQQVQALYPTLTMVFIPHTSGTFREIVSSHEHEISTHAAGKTAQDILERYNDREQSSFIGMANHHKVKWFGLASSESSLALLNINADEFIHARDLRRTVYQLAWHVIDLMEVRQKKEFAAKFRSGPMIPKRSPMNLARLNMQADIFSAMMCGLHGEENTFESIAKARAKDTVLPVSLRRAEDYPFIIALEPAKYAFDVLASLKPAKAKFMRLAKQATLEVSKTFDEKSIRQWWGFSEPAQDMAWRNISPDVILGCAIRTSENAFVRAIAHSVAELAAIDPSETLTGPSFYNAFASKEHNTMLHAEIAEKTFEEAVNKGIVEVSGQSLISAANEQNENLTEGLILGWCANALQAASRAFDTALTTGASPAHAARMEFMVTKDVPPWETLKKLSEEIVSQKRASGSMTMGQVADIAGTNDDFKTLLTSMRATMADPGYVKKLDAANDLAVKPTFQPGPKAPSAAPKVSVPTGPAIGPSAPGLGLGGSGAGMRRIMAERQRLHSLGKELADESSESNRTET